MDVMQREVEIYENEIRAFKDQKTPKRPGTATRGTPRRSMKTSVDLSSPHSIGLPTPGGTGGMGMVGDELYGNTGVLEATLFCPALQNALREANHWKAAAVASSILDLPPLPSRYYNADGSMEADPNYSYSYYDDWIHLSFPVNHNRIVKASVRLVDLTGKNNLKPPRQQLIDMKTMNRIVTEKLETAMLRSRSEMVTL
jgi:hypothetical protein